MLLPEHKSSFQRKDNLLKHLKSHKNDFSCEYCDKYFISEMLLDLHVKIHFFQCDICGKTFKNKKGLSMHMQTYINKTFIENKDVIQLDNTTKNTSANNRYVYQRTDTSEGLPYQDPVFTGIPFNNPLYDCYINATINGIFSSSKMRNIIMASNKSDKIVDKLQQVVRNKGLQYLESLKEVNKKKFQNANQHDAAEFLEYLLNYLHEVLPELSITYKFATNEWNKCSHCPGEVIYPSDLQSILHLPMTDNVTNIQQLIDKFFSTGETDKKCTEEGCGNKMIRKMKVEKAPQVLILQLMRYQGSLTLTKNTNPIQPSVEIKFHTSAYHLKSIIQHQGDFNRGHYTTLLNLGKQWTQCNDTFINQD